METGNERESGAAMAPPPAPQRIWRPLRLTIYLLP
jgi:hypothetical protein